MARSLLPTRHDVKRLHSRDRRRGYITPTARDEQCTHYDGLFALMGQAPIVNDMMSLCHADSSVSCDYKEDIAGMSFCKRYVKDSIKNFVQEYIITEDETINWQDLHLDFQFQRLFENRKALVSVTMTRSIKESIDLGNFLSEWQEWSESQRGDWKERVNGSRTEIYNAVNQSGRSFWYNPIHKDEDNYIHDYYVQARGGDNDMYGSVFRYNPDTGNFYSFEWDSGGVGINGMAVFRNVYIGGVLHKTRLAHSPVRWVEGAKYIHRVRVHVVGSRITVEAYRVSGSSQSLLAKLEVVDTPAETLWTGAWGPMTNSQPDTYFWQINYEQIKVVDKNVYSQLSQWVPLEYVGVSGGKYIVSKSMNEFFDEAIKRSLDNQGIDPAEITQKEYIIEDTNVFEGVVFEHQTFSPLVSTTDNTRIGMTSFNYGSDMEHLHDLSIPSRHIPNASYSYISTLDMSLMTLSVSTTRPHFFDYFEVRIDGKLYKMVPNVEHKTYFFDSTRSPVQLEIGSTIEFIYTPSTFDFTAYRGGYIDTHDKLFTVRGNELNWHIVPSRE